MNTILPATIGFVIGTLAVVGAASAVLNRHDKVLALVMCGIACFFGGLAVAQMNTGNEQAMPFAPSWLWVVMFVFAGLFFVVALLVWLAVAIMKVALKRGIATSDRAK